MADIDPYELALRQELGLPIPEEQGLWGKITQPVRTAFGFTQGLGGKAAGVFAPEAYRKAQEELQAATGVSEESPWYRQIEAQPGLGDVLAQQVPESVRESIPGRVVGPVARLAGNIAGDPTTWTPAVVSKVGKLAIARVPEAAAAAAEGAKATAGATRAAFEASQATREGNLAAAEFLGGEASRLSTRADALAGEVSRAMSDAPVMPRLTFQAAETFHNMDPLGKAGAAAAVVYGPQVVENTWDSLKQAFTADEVSDKLVGGANALLMAGLGGLMAKGLLDVGRAREVLAKQLMREAPVGESTVRAFPEEARPEAPPVETPPTMPRAEPAPDVAAREAVVPAAETPPAEMPPARPTAPQEAITPEARPAEAPPARVEPTVEEVTARPTEVPRPVEAPAPHTPEVPVTPEVAPVEVVAPHTEAPRAPEPVVEAKPPEAVVAPKVAEAPVEAAVPETLARKPLAERTMDEHLESAVRHVGERNPELAGDLKAALDRGDIGRRAVALFDAVPEDARSVVNPQKLAYDAVRKELAGLKKAKLPEKAAAPTAETSVAAPERKVAKPTGELGAAGAGEAGTGFATTELGGTAVFGKREAAAAERARRAAEKEPTAFPRVKVALEAAPEGAPKTFGALVDRMEQAPEPPGRFGSGRVFEKAKPFLRRYAELVDSGVERGDAIKQMAAEGKWSESPTLRGAEKSIRNYVGDADKLFHEWAAKALPAQAQETLRAREIEAPKPSVVERLRETKTELESRIEKVKDKAELQTWIHDYARMIGQRGELKKLPADLTSDRVLKEAAKARGIKFDPKENARVVLERMAAHEGLDRGVVKQLYEQTRMELRSAKKPVFTHEGFRVAEKGVVGEGGTGIEFRDTRDPARKGAFVSKLPEDASGFQHDMQRLVDNPGITDVDLPAKKPGKVNAVVSDLMSQGKLELADEYEVKKIGREKYRVVRGQTVEQKAETLSRDHLRRTVADSQLSPQMQLQRAISYSLEKGKDGVYHHDQMMSPEHIEALKPLAQQVTPGLRSAWNVIKAAVKKELGQDVDGDFMGVTASPYLAGLRLQAPGKKGQVFLNLVEAVHASKDYDDAVSKMMDTMAHEAAHAVTDEHGQIFFDTFGKVHKVIESNFERLRNDIESVLTEADYQRIKKELVPEFRLKRQEINGESWRKVRPEQGVPAGAAEGGAAAQPNRPLGGAAGAEADRVGGVQPGGAVERGSAVEAGQLRPAAALGRGAAGGAAEGEGAGPAAWRVATAPARGPIHTNEEALRRIDEIVEMSRRMKLPKEKVLDDLTSVAEWRWEGMSPDERAAKAAEFERMVPAPRKAGQVEGPINTLHWIGELGSPELRGKMKLVLDYAEEKKLFERNKTVSFDAMSEGARRILGQTTFDDFLHDIKRRKGVTPEENVALGMLHRELYGQITDAEGRYFDAVAGNLPEEQLAPLRKAAEDAQQRWLAAGITVANKRTGLARALAAGRIEMIRQDPRAYALAEFKANLKEKLRTRIRDTGKLNEATEKLYQQFTDIWDKRKNGDEFLRLYKSLMERGSHVDQLLEFYKMGLLGWPSQAANFASNVLMVGMRQLEGTVAGMIDWTASKLKPGRERQIFAGEHAVAARALSRAVQEGIPAFTRDMKDALFLAPPDVLKMIQTGSIAEDLFHAQGAIPGKVGEFIRFHGKAMSAADTLAKHVSGLNYVYRTIYRNIRKGVQGFEKLPAESAVQATERMAQEATKMRIDGMNGRPIDGKRFSSLYHDIFEKADQVAREETFQSDLGNLGRAMQSLAAEHRWMQVLFPFIRTPTNIAKQTIERTPAGFVQLIRKWKELTPAERVTELSKPMTGTAIMGAFAAIAASGQMTGGGPVDFESQEALKAIGWQPYSFKIGNEWVSYQRLEPVASIFGFAADMVEAAKRGETGDVRAFTEKALSSIAENLTNKTFLSTMETAFSAISRPQQYAGQFFKQLQSGIVPNSLGFVPFGHLARAIDPVYRQTEPLSPAVFLAKVPGASTLLPPQYGPTGQERVRTGTALERLVSPFQHQAEEIGTARALGTQEIVRLDTVPKTPMRYWTSPQGYRVPLKPEERQLVAKSLQRAVDTIGQQLVKDPGYRALPDDENDPNYVFGQRTKADVVKRLLNRYRNTSLVQIKPALLSRARQMYSENKRG